MGADCGTRPPSARREACCTAPPSQGVSLWGLPASGPGPGREVRRHTSEWGTRTPACPGCGRGAWGGAGAWTRAFPLCGWCFCSARGSPRPVASGASPSQGWKGSLEMETLPAVCQHQDGRRETETFRCLPVIHPDEHRLTLTQPPWAQGDRHPSSILQGGCQGAVTGGRGRGGLGDSATSLRSTP